MNNKAENFLLNFFYEPDTKDTWRILKPDQYGVYEGDCEDFSLTLLFLLSDESWFKLWLKVLTCQAVLWHSTVDKEGHIMLWHKGKGWIDNRTRVWSRNPPAKKIYPLWGPLLAAKLLLKYRS